MSAMAVRESSTGSTAARAAPAETRELRFYGLQRSGNHAIINWIIRQTEGPVSFYNDADPDNPYDPARLQPIERDQAVAGGPEYKLVSFEDRVLTVHALLPGHDPATTHAGATRSVLILRDPFNLFASRARHGVVSDRSSSYISGLTVPELWTSYAMEALGRTRHLGRDTVVANYNRWRVDSAYREQLAAELGLTFTDRGFTEVTRYGAGSSFDGQAFAGDASRMEVSSRWKAFANDAAYRDLFRDPLILELARELFSLDDELDSFARTQLEPRASRLIAARRALALSLLPALIARARRSPLIRATYRAFGRRLLGRVRES